jgi:hypothetical protein
MPDTPTKKCSQGHENDLDAIFCGSCGEKFKQEVICRKCGTANTVGEKFCGGCGEKLSGARVLCKYCGSTVDSGAVFCGECGKPTEEKVLCKKCGATIDKESTVCSKCGASTEDSRHGIRWMRDRDDFAKRVDVEKLRGAFQTGIVVEEGTKALLLQNGALVASLEPGFYEMKTFTEALKESLIKAGGAVVKGGAAVVRGVKGFAAGLFNKEIPDTGTKTNEAIDKAVESMLAQDCTVLLVDAGDVEIKLNLSNVYTSDPFGIDISCNAVLRMQEPRLFFVNVMKSQVFYRVTDLKDSLSLEMQNAFSEVIGKKSVTDLNSDLSLKQEFENIVKEHMNRTLGQSYGLNFFQLRTIAYSFKHFDQIRGIHEEVFFQVSKDEAALQGRKRLFDVFDKEQIQEIAEVIKKTEHYRKLSAAEIDRKKAEAEQEIGLKKTEAEKDIGLQGVDADKEIDEIKLYADTRRRLREHLLDGTKTDEDIQKFLFEIEKGRLLRDQELLEFKRLLDEKNDDHKLKREFLLKKLELEQDLDFKRLGITGEGDLKKLDLTQELDYEKTRLLGKSGIEYDLAELDEKKKRMQFDSDLSMARIARAEERDAFLQQEMVKIQASQAEDLADLKTAEIAQELMLNMKRKKSEIELNEKRQLQIMQLEKETKQLEMRLMEEKARHEREMEKTRTDQEHELKKIAALSGASAEAIISMSGPEQARMLTELKQTEALKDFSEEKILAMAAEKSPEVAKAFQEKYKGLPKEETERLYKMVLEEKDKASKMVFEAKDKAIADKDKSSAEKDKFISDAMERFERITTKALDSQKDAAIGVAQGTAKGNTPHVVYPPQGQSGFYGGPVPGQSGSINVNQMSQPGGGAAPSGQPENKVCINPDCQAIIPITKKFCPHCGKDQTIT